MDLGASLLALLDLVVFKAAVMGLGGWLLLRLYRVRRPAEGRRLWLLVPQAEQPSLRVLWWSLVFFAASELSCGIEVYVLMQSNQWLTGFHALVSATGMALFALGAYQLLDARVIRFGRTGCAINRFCRGCTIEQPEGCKLRTLMLLLGTLLVLAALPPLFASTAELHAIPQRYLLPFPQLNGWYDGTVVPWIQATFPGTESTGSAYFLPTSMLFLEFRVIPLAGMGLALAGVAALLLGRDRLGPKLLLLAAGPLAYTYFELVVYVVIGEVILGSLAHEVGEFWFMLATVEFLRRTLGAPPAPPSP